VPIVADGIAISCWRDAEQDGSVTSKSWRRATRERATPLAVMAGDLPRRLTSSAKAEMPASSSPPISKLTHPQGVLDAEDVGEQDRLVAGGVR